MALRTAIADTTLVSTTGWGSATNTPTIHATTNITVSTTARFTQGFTAPNTTNKCVGVWFECITVGTGDWTVTLQENTVDTAATATVSASNITATYWVYFEFSVPYTFTTTSASAYRFKLVSGAVGTGGTVAADSAGLNSSFMAVDDRTGALGSTDDLWIAAPNLSGTRTVTVSGTSNLCGSGTTTALPGTRGYGWAVNINRGGLFTWDTTASATLTVLGSTTIAPGGELRQGTSGTAYPAAYTAKLRFNENGANASYGVRAFPGSKVTVYGNPLAYYKTTVASGTGTVGDPLITTDPVDWSVGDQIIVPATSNNATNYNETENRQIVTKNSSTSYVLQDANLVAGGDMETALATNWTLTTTGGSIAQDAVIFHAGANSAKLTRTTATVNMLQNVTVVPGAWYELRYWYQDNGTVSTQYTILDATNGNATIIGTTSTTAAGAVWTEAVANFQAPSNCTSVTIKLFSPSTNATSVWIDDVTVRLPAFTYSHPAGTDIYNITRNVIWETTVSTLGFFFYNGSTIAGNVAFKWMRFNSTGSNATNLNGILLSSASNTYGAADYCVFNAATYRGMFISTSKTVETFTGNIACNQNSPTNAVGAICTSAVANKTLIDCVAIRCNRTGYEILNTYNSTFTRCKLFSGNTAGLAASATVGGALYLTAGSPTFDSCEFHANRNYCFQANANNGATFKNCLFGTKGTNVIDVWGVDATQNNVDFNNCSFGSATLIGNYLAQLDGTEFRFYKYQQTEGRHRWYTNYGSAKSTGAGLTDTNVRTPGSLGVVMLPEDNATGFTWAFNIPAKANSIVSFLGWFQLNSTFTGDAAASARVELWLPGSVVADATSTLSLVTNSWQAAVLSAQNNLTSDSLAEVRVTGLTATTGAYLYADDFYNAGDTVTSTDKVTGLDAWYKGKPLSIIQPSATSAADIWSFPTTNLTIGGTIGNLVTKLLTLGKFIGLK